MDTVRILLVSNVRPSRTWKLAHRISREVPGAEICGIVQRPVRQLPVVQRLIATGRAYQACFFSGGRLRVTSWLTYVLEGILHWILWFIHGCPRLVNGVKNFTAENLAQECAKAGWPFLLAADVSDTRVVDFIRERAPGLVFVLGQLPVNPDLLAVPLHGLIQVCQSGSKNNRTKVKDRQIRIEHLTKDSLAASTIASVAVPLQCNDGLLGITLKTDLISDDLLVQTAASLQTGSMTQAFTEVKEWIHRMLSPYLTQLEPARIEKVDGRARSPRYRSAWTLCMESLFLSCSLVVARNLYRRWRGRYPVLILSHHLVSDRLHQMAVPTETFWRQVRFLQRYYRIVSLSEAAELLRSGNVKIPTIVLTFDDGYVDNYVNLRAVAEETEIPVALCIATQLVETRQEFHHDLVKGRRGFFPLTWDQIRYWSHRGAEFGSHTRTHFDCSSTDRTRLEQEIVGSKNDLEHYLGTPVQCFAFPFGGHQNMSSEAIDVAASAYPYFISCCGGENHPDRAVSRRHLLRKTFYPDLWELELELQSVFDFADTLKRRLRLKRQVSTHTPGRLSAASVVAVSGDASSPNSGYR